MAQVARLLAPSQPKRGGVCLCRGAQSRGGRRAGRDRLRWRQRANGSGPRVRCPDCRDRRRSCRRLGSRALRRAWRRDAVAAALRPALHTARRQALLKQLLERHARDGRTAGVPCNAAVPLQFPRKEETAATTGRQANARRSGLGAPPLGLAISHQSAGARLEASRLGAARRAKRHCRGDGFSPSRLGGRLRRQRFSPVLQRTVEVVVVALNRASHQHPKQGEETRGTFSICVNRTGGTPNGRR
jgi:hypothetical protein